MNYLVILLFIIIIILLLLKLFDVELFDNEFLIRGDGTVKLDTSPGEVKYKHYSNIEHTNEQTNNQLIGYTNKTEKVENVGVENNQEEKINYENKKSDEVLDELSHRYDNQEEEYKQAFSGKNELDYDGNVITDENIYQFDDFNYINANQLYIPTDYKTKEEDYGRNYIPPEIWYKNNRRLNLPVCVPANHRCTIKDNLTSGYPLDNVEWHSARKITNPQGISVKYIKENSNQ